MMRVSMLLPVFSPVERICVYGVEAVGGVTSRLYW
jgi:hypothetical protein